MILNKTGKKKIVEIFFGVFAFFIMIGLAFSPSIVSSEIQQGKSVNSYSPEALNSAQCTNSKAVCIYNKNVEKTFPQGTVYYNFYVYSCCGDLIYVVNSHLTACSGYWLAGNIRGTDGHWTGKTFLCCAESRNPSDALQKENFIGYSPCNELSSGYAGTVTTGYKITGSASAPSCGGFDTTLSGSYSFTYSYNVPMFEINPLSETESKAAWEFSDNLDQTSVKPEAASYVVSAVASGSFPNGMDAICINDQGQFAHTGYFYITAYNWDTLANEIEFQP
jgi:hypothetical protein